MRSVPADPPPEALYAVVRTLETFEEPGTTWAAALGDQNASASVRHDTSQHHGGRASLCVDYDFIGKPALEYILITGAVEFPTPGLGVGFWMKHRGPPLPLRLRFVDAGGESHQTELLASPTGDWQFVAGSLDSHSESWGGDGNKRKDYPCKLIGICFDRPEVRFVGRGALWIDDVALLRPATPSSHAFTLETSTPRFGNLYTVGDTVTLRAAGDADRVRWAVTDFFGRKLAGGEGPAAGTQVSFALPRPGWFSCRLDLVANNQPVAPHLFACGALPPNTNAPRFDFFGVGTHYGQQAYPLETMDLMKRYGIDQFRDEISWGSYEREKGHLALPDFAATYLKRASECGLRPLIIFDYANQHYDNGGFPNSPEAIAAFARYAVDLARHTRGQVGMFEVWNEWVGGCGMDGKPGVHDGAAYGRLLQPTYAAVKQAFPDLTVVGIGGEYGPHCAETILAALGTAGTNAMDAWSIHPYRYPRPPETASLADEVARLADRVRAAGETSRAWITEIGYPTHRGSAGCSEATQARLLVRTLALLQSSRVVDKVFWYDLKNDGLRRDYNEHNFGLIHHEEFNCAPKPAMLAASTFIRMTAPTVFRELERSGPVWSARYQALDNRDLLLVWTEQDSNALSLTGTVESVVDLMGGEQPLNQPIQASPSPIYVIGRNLHTR